MKIVLVLLAALCGLSAGIQFPYSYQYQYSGEVKTGIHELRDQYAGARLTATVKITVASSSIAHFQISEPQVGSSNSDVASSGRAPLPISHMESLKDKSAVEQPFVVHFSGQQEKLEVPSGELLWISNLKKSIASLFRVPFVLSQPNFFSSNVQENKITSQGDYPTSFERQEETIHGKCSVVYTLTKAAPNEYLHLKEIKEDAQHPGGQTNSSAYRLVRSVDFDACSERVVLKKSSHGNLTEAGIGQLRGIQSRSAVGEYLLTGDPSQELSMRVEQAIVEGVTTMNPFGHQTKKIMTFTNQTLSLISCTIGQIVPPPRSVKSEIWAFRVSSPFQRGSESPSWISFQGNNDATYPTFPEQDLTGYSLTPEYRQQLQSEISTSIEEVARQVQTPNGFQQGSFGGSKDGAAVQKLASVASKIRALQMQDLEQLFQQIVSSQSSSSPHQTIKRELFISALKVAGSAGSIRVLIEKSKSGDISEFEAATMFVTLSANIGSPVIVNDLIDYVISIPDDASIALKSSSLINLSTMIRRVCLNKAVQTYSTPIDMMGRNQCSHIQVFSKYIPYLKSKVQSASKTYLKAIYIQAMANLGDISTVSMLGDIARGKLLHEETPLRLLAIQGLSKNHMVNTSYHLATEVLLSLAESQVEQAVLREAAYVSLFSLPKNATFWHRTALSTWREPSRRVASFVYASIKAHAASKNPHFIHQISMAKHVLPLAKPQPRSPYYSGHFLSSHYETTEDFAGISEAVYLASSTSQIPEMFSGRLKTVFGGMKYPILHVSTIGKGIENAYNMFLDKFKQFKQGPLSVHNPNHRKSTDEFGQATKSHMFSGSQADEENVLLAHLTIFKHMETFWPITQDSISQFGDASKSLIASAIKKLQDGETVQGLSYYTTTEVTEILPSDIGLPIITQVSRPTMVYSQVKGSAVIYPKYRTPLSLLTATSINVTGEAIFKSVSKSEISVKILVPWSNRTLVTGMDGESTFSFPTKFSIGLNRESSSETLFQVSIEPTFPHKAPVMLLRNLPYTLERPLFSARDVTDLSVLPINVLNKSPRYQSSVAVSKSVTGLEAELQYQGDTEFPINRTTVWERLMRPVKAVTLVSSPTCRQYQLALVYSADDSETKQMTGTVSVVSLQQEGSHDSSSQQEHPPVVEDLSASDSMQQRIMKLSKAGVSKMVSASLNFSSPAAQPRKYEAAVFVFPQYQTHSGEVERASSQFQVNLMRSSAPTTDSQPSMQICASSSVQYPRLPVDAQVNRVLQSNLDVSFVSQLYSGDRCNQKSQLYTLRGNQSISQERKDHLQSPDLSEDQYPPLDSTEAVKSAPVYDIFNVDIKEEHAPSDSMMNFTNQVSDVIHGVLFPNIIHNGINVHGQQGLTVIQGTRSVATDRYVFWVRTSESICLAQDLKVHAIFDYVSPLNVYWQPSSQEANPTQTSLE